MVLLRKHTQVIVLGALLLLYAGTRFLFLTNLPIFTDESIYIYWAKYIETNHSHWFLSLTDGKPPLLIWAIGIFLSIFPDNWYLISGRLPSVIAGGASVIGIYFLAKTLFQSPRGGYISSLLYIISPFTLFYDRMALFDSLLSSMLIWSVYFAIKTGISFKVKDAVLWGLFLGLAFLSKPTAIIFMLLTPLGLLLFINKEKLKKHFKKIILLIFLALGISQIINNLQRLSDAYPQAAIKNQQFQQPISELLANPFALVESNLNGFSSWIIAYYTLPVFILGIFCFVLLCFRFPKVGFFVLSLWIVPIAIFAIVGREIFPRYILFITPYFFLPIGYGINLILSQRPAYKLLFISVLLIVFYPSVFFSYLVVTNPVKAPFPVTDYHQYVADHPSGYGLDRIFTFLRREGQKNKVTVFVQGTFGLYPYAFDLEFWNNPNITILGRWPLDKIDDEIIQIQKKEKVYIILKEHDKIPENLPLELVLKAEKPGGRYPILVTTLKNE